MNEEQTIKRTNQQSKALHLWCSMLAEAYNERGLDIATVIENYTMDAIWTRESVKEVLIKHILRNVFGKQSTTELLKVGELDKLIDMITKFNAKMEIEYIPFPSVEHEQEELKNIIC